MTDPAITWMTDGLTARVLGAIPEEDLDRIAQWLPGNDSSCPLPDVRVPGPHRFTGSHIERSTPTTCCGVFLMDHGLLRGASVHVWTAYPATVLSAIAGQDAGHAMDWAFLDGLRVIDAISYPPANNIPARTHIRLDAPLKPLLPLLER